MPPHRRGKHNCLEGLTVIYFPIKIVCNCVLCQAKQYQVTIWVEPTNPPTYHLVEDGFQDAEGKDVSVSKWNEQIEHVTSCGL